MKLSTYYFCVKTNISPDFHICFSAPLSNRFFTDCLHLVVNHHEKLIVASGSSRPEVFCKKVVLKNFAKFTGKHVCHTLAQVFSFEFCEIAKNTFSYRTPPVFVSEMLSLISEHNSVEKAENVYQELKEKKSKLFRFL